METKGAFYYVAEPFPFSQSPGMQSDRLFSIALVAWTLCGGSLASGQNLAWGHQGAVTSAERHATQAGIGILKSGGNAVDAAVAVGFALAVTHPAAGNIGGGGFMLIRMADGHAYFLDFREEAPGKAGPKMYLDKNGNYILNSSIVGFRAIGIPGSVAGLTMARRRLGKLSLAADMAPAIRLAAGGYRLSYTQAQDLHSPYLGRFNGSRRTFQRNGKFYLDGEVFRQPHLAATLRAIAAGGARVFYHGAMARELASYLQRHGGLITAADLARYRARWRTPLYGHYRGYTILTSPPPSSGGVCILEMLHMLEPTRFWRYGFQSALSLHYQIEAMRRAFADRAVYLGDPDFERLPVRQLLRRSWARQRWASFRPNLASRSAEVGAGPLPGFESTQTTSYSVVDQAGNAVAVTYTLNNWFGSGVTDPRLGFLLNDEMDDFTSKPGVPNMFGLIQGRVNQIEPYKRPLSSMVPTIVTQHHRLYMVLGSPGGPRIITTVYEIISNRIDFHLPLRNAVAAARFHQQWMPDVVDLEQYGFSSDTRRRLQAMGYVLKLQPDWCDGEAIGVGRSGTLAAVSDNRRTGSAGAY